MLNSDSKLPILKDGKQRIRSPQACLECRQAKIKCDGKRKDSTQCTRCSQKNLTCLWVLSKRGKKPGTKNLATRAREQREVLVGQLDQQQILQQEPQLDNRIASLFTGSPEAIRKGSSDAAIAISNSSTHGTKRSSATQHQIDSLHLAKRYSSDVAPPTLDYRTNSISSLSVSSSSPSGPPSLTETISLAGANERRTSKYHYGLLIRESRMPPSSTNPLLCLSEAALGNKGSLSDSEEDDLPETRQDRSVAHIRASPAAGHGLHSHSYDSLLDDLEDEQSRSGRDIVAMLERNGWVRSHLAQAACERASYFSGASASVSWDTRRCDPIDRGIVSMDDATRLFQIFMDTVNEQFCVFDPVIHNVNTIKESSNFLFSVVLAIAASVDRTPHSIQQFQLLHGLVESLIVEVLSRNVKSVEVVKGLLFWPLWAHLTPLMADDRAWLMIGTAARMTKELDLCMKEDLPLQDEIARRQARDRSRTWILAAILERSFSSFSGQRPNTTLDLEWTSINDWIKSPIMLDGDVELVAFLYLRRVEENMRSRIFCSNTFEIGSLESTRASANVLFDAWLEGWCHHPKLRNHPLTSTIMKITGLHVQILINTHAIREGERRKQMCQAAGHVVLKMCSASLMNARERCVSLLQQACNLAVDQLQDHAANLSRIVSAMLGWSGVHLLKNGPVETRELVVRLGLMLACSPNDPVHARSFPRFYGRFILSLSSELVERDRTERAKRSKTRSRRGNKSSASPITMSTSSSQVASPSDSTATTLASSNPLAGSHATSGNSLNATGFKMSPGSAPASEMALAFETAADHETQINSGRDNRSSDTNGDGVPSSKPTSISSASALSQYYLASSRLPSILSTSSSSSIMNSISAPSLDHQVNATGPTSSATAAAVAATVVDPVAQNWLGTDDLLDQYMQSILPISHNDFDASATPNMAASVGSLGGTEMLACDFGF